MPVAIKTVQTPVYENLTEIYGNYCTPNRFVMFEGQIYKYKGIRFKNDTKIHYFRCESERHNLVIHLQEGDVFYVEAFYSVDEVMAHESDRALQVY